MQPNATTDIKEVSTQEFQTFKMGFDEQAIVHLMDVLTNLYSDAELAVIREYSSNAWDSHLAAGNTEPIQISLPGPFQNNFVVEDFGVGLSTDDIHNIYSKYGKSTKRNNNAETGMLGLGCKSALAYVKSFTITAVKDGVQTIAVISRGEDGAGHIQILDTSKTSKPNGVKVEIPLPRNTNTSLFAEKVKNFLSYWEPGRVLLNGSEPSQIEGIKVGNAMLHTGGYGKSSHFVMGGVPYPIVNSTTFGWLPYNYRVTIWVDMGEVNFTPSREALHYTERTNKTLNRESEKLKAAMNQKLEAELKAINEPRKAIDFVDKWRPFLRDPKWRGVSVREPISLGRTEAMRLDDRYPALGFRPFAGRGAIDKMTNVHPDTLVESMQVTGFENKTLSPANREKIRVYLEDNDLDAKTVIMTKSFIDTVWTTDVHTVDYSEILAIKLQTTMANRSIFQDVRFYQNGMPVEAKDIDSSTEIIMTTTAFEVTPRQVSLAWPDSYVAVLAENRWEKFARENKSAVNIRQKVDNEVADISKTWNVCQLVQQNVGSAAYRLGGVVSRLVPVEASRFDDPLVSKYAGMAQRVDSKHQDRLQRLRNVANMMRKKRFDRGYDVTIEADKDELDELGSILASYPLIPDCDETKITVDYVNAMYAYRKDNK